MSQINDMISKYGSKILTIVLLVVFLGLAGFITYQILAPLNPEVESNLEKEILGTKVVFDKNVISRVEKRKDYGRAIETAYVDDKRAKLKDTGVPENFFDPSRLNKFF